MDLPHETAASIGPGIPGRVALGLVEVNGIPKTLVLREGEPEAAVGIDVVKLEILCFEPGMVPIQAFTAAELPQQIFLADPIQNPDQ